MKYEEKLLELMFDTDSNALVRWVKSHPILEQVEIAKEYAAIIKKRLHAKGDYNNDHLCDEMIAKAETMQESFLDEQLANLKYELAMLELEEAEAEFDEAYAALISHLRQCVEANGTDAAEARAVVANIIAQQKKDGFYDPLEWDWFQE
jgi:hypothetical protein